MAELDAIAYIPAAHSVHALAPARAPVSVIEPAPHAMQLVASAAGWYSPAAHSRHSFGCGSVGAVVGKLVGEAVGESVNEGGGDMSSAAEPRDSRCCITGMVKLRALGLWMAVG